MCPGVAWLDISWTGAVVQVVCAMAVPLNASKTTVAVAQRFSDMVAGSNINVHSEIEACMGQSEPAGGQRRFEPRSVNNLSPQNQAGSAPNSLAAMAFLRAGKRLQTG